MKTIKQIAEELGVSKQAVHKRISREPLASRIRPSTVRRQQTIYIDVHGETLIKEAFEGRTVNDDNRQPSMLDDSLVDVLRRELEVKNRQIEAQAEQITNLSSTLAAAQQTIKDDRQTLETALQTAAIAAKALSDATVKPHLETDAPKPRERGFLRRIFGKNDET